MAVLTAWGSMNRITRALKVVYESLKVVGAFFKIPAFLITTGLIMEDTDD